MSWFKKPQKQSSSLYDAPPVVEEIIVEKNVQSNFTAQPLIQNPPAVLSPRASFSENSTTSNKNESAVDTGAKVATTTTVVVPSSNKPLVSIVTADQVENKEKTKSVKFTADVLEKSEKKPTKKSEKSTSAASSTSTSSTTDKNPLSNDPSILSKPSEVQHLLVECATLMETVSRKISDSSRLCACIEQIQDTFQSRYDDLRVFLENPQLASPKTPLSTETTLQVHLLTRSYYDFFKSVLELRDYLKRSIAAILPLVTKRQRITKMVLNLQQDWTSVNINLTTLIARTSTDMVRGATSDLGKIAIASGATDWEEIDSNDAQTVFLQGEKYFLGYGVPVDYALAYKRYQSAANNGIAAAYHMLGTMHELGLGREISWSIATEYYEKAAELGSSDALNSLGKAYEKGHCCPLDWERAKESFRKAALLGNFDAMVNLGHLLEKMACDNENDEPELEAFRWFTKAAESGYARAQNALGSCYYRGTGTSQDYAKAFEWFRKAADQHNISALNNLGTCYEEGLAFPQDLGLAKSYYKAAADKMHPSATSSYAYLLYLEQNYRDAVKYFNIGYSLGSADAAYHLGTLYESGNSVKGTLPRDLEMALFYYEEALARNYSKAFCRAAAIQLFGPLTLRDYSSALLKLLKGTELKDSESMFLLGNVYLNGLEISAEIEVDSVKFNGKADAERAVHWFKQASKLGHAGSLYQIGLVFECGLINDADLPMAVKYYRQAAKMGYKPAQLKIDDFELMGVA